MTTVPYFTVGKGVDVDDDGYSGEASTMGLVGFPLLIWVHDPATGRTTSFERGKADWDGSREDIYGVHYAATTGEHLLVIND